MKEQEEPEELGADTAGSRDSEAIDHRKRKSAWLPCLRRLGGIDRGHVPAGSVWCVRRPGSR
jgi:hypothetical protein